MMYAHPYADAIHDRLNAADELAVSDATRSVLNLHGPFRVRADDDEYVVLCFECSRMGGIVGTEYPCNTTTTIAADLGIATVEAN